MFLNYNIMANICRKFLISRLIPNTVNACFNSPSCLTNCYINSPILSSQTYNCDLQIRRFKSKKSKVKRTETDSESEKESDALDFLDTVTDKNTKILKINVNSLRLDAILKSGLGIARNKIEVLFYESKIRVNEEKVLKKSVTVKEGDEIDVIKGASISNPDFIVVTRVEILQVTPKEESLNIKIRRCKSLTVENYENKFKA